MAAILCESISTILRGTCDAVGTVLTLPCKACGLATDQITNVCRSPFCLYLSVALGLNIPPIIFTARSYGGCESSLNWMYINAVLCSINILAALYISAKISHGGDDADTPFIQAEAGVNDGTTTGATTQPEKKTFVETIIDNAIKTRVDSATADTRSTNISRVKHTLCYDFWVALYIIVGVFFMIWQTMGVSKMGSCGDGEVDTYLAHSLICGFMFISFGGMAFGCSLCCLVK